MKLAFSDIEKARLDSYRLEDCDRAHEILNAAHAAGQKLIQVEVWTPDDSAAVMVDVPTLLMAAKVERVRLASMLEDMGVDVNK